MEIFTNKQYEQRHEQLEQELRSLSETVAQLTIEAGAARADIERLRQEQEQAPKVDPHLVALDADLSEARAKLSAVHSATSEAWADVYGQMRSSMRKVLEEVDAAGADRQTAKAGEEPSND